MTKSALRTEPVLDRLIADLHSERLRVWSIVISFFGDAITPRGGVLWLSTFRTLAGRLGIESGTVGAAMSRLTADGWLVREKKGRHTFYRLDASGRAEFENADQKIYGLERRRTWNGRWTIVIHRGDDPMPDDFIRVDESTWAKPDWGSGPADTLPGGAVVFDAATSTSSGLPDLIEDAWNLRPYADAYRTWLERFEPLAEALDSGPGLDPLSAMCARVLLVHDFRRVVLKEPDIPDELRRDDWPGHDARRQAAALYRTLLPASEQWLDSPDVTPEGPLPKPKARFYRRFGGLK